MGTGSFPGVNQPGRGADSHLQCRGLKKDTAIPLSTLRALVAYKGGTFTFTFCSYNIQEWLPKVFYSERHTDILLNRLTLPRQHTYT